MAPAMDYWYMRIAPLQRHWVFRKACRMNHGFRQDRSTGKGIGPSIAHDVRFHAKNTASFVAAVV